MFINSIGNVFYSARPARRRLRARQLRRPPVPARDRAVPRAAPRWSPPRRSAPTCARCWTARSPPTGRCCATSRSTRSGRSAGRWAAWTCGARTRCPPARRRGPSSRPRRKRAQLAILAQASGGAPPPSPYIPLPSAYPRNAGAVTVLNSVGIAGVRGVEPPRRAGLIGALRGATRSPCATTARARC